MCNNPGARQPAGLEYIRSHDRLPEVRDRLYASWATPYRRGRPTQASAGCPDLYRRDTSCRSTSTLIFGMIGSSTDLSRVQDARDGTFLPWWQILPAYRLPPFGACTRGVTRERPCPACNRDGYFHTVEEPFQPAYCRSAFSDPNAWPRADGLPPDFAFTHEYFGNSSPEDSPTGRVYAQPLVMVSNRVLRVFLDHRVRGAVFVPTRVLS